MVPAPVPALVPLSVFIYIYLNTFLCLTINDRNHRLGFPRRAPNLHGLAILPSYRRPLAATHGTLTPASLHALGIPTQYSRQRARD